MVRLMKILLGGTGLVSALFLLSACTSEVSSSGSADVSGLQEQITSLEKKLADQSEKTSEQNKKIADLEKKVNELNSIVIAVDGADGKAPAATGNNGSAGKGDGILITFAQYEKLEVGMSVEDVIEILGGEGEALSEAENMVVYNYKGTAGNGANAVIAFQGGKLLTKAQSGLE
ncbi:hypothetical protein [Paenibacillus pabuli]|uniref:hypothetical protein n=1 Tax=Paenibacillus pabuli TaxID=1472 RepID=UPI000AA36F48|nr:hypothetical protein [Paenibacillus pabuli]MEC0123303.1 hypothetical protein [Paenibacillus pabuli]